jgi:hypothetical protein
MLKIEDHQMDRFRDSRRAALVGKLDTFLSGEMASWPVRTSQDRHDLLVEFIARGEALKLVSERDFALFARLMAELGEGRGAFLERPEIVEVTQWTTRNPMAKLREMYRRADILQQTGEI